MMSNVARVTQLVMAEPGLRTRSDSIVHALADSLNSYQAWVNKMQVIFHYN